ncbi:MAG: preprotein translocase subunit YajC [Candidatus Omnitrophica bacterium]|nr:preprotein translocase subunit YajC [Candidatus Omnitrophota bacterium]
MPNSSPVINPLINLFPLIIIFAIFYFLIIKPQRIREKEHQKMLANLNKNDEVVTTGGIHGVIANVKEKTVTLKIDDNVKIELEKNCIAYVKKKDV